MKFNVMIARFPYGGCEEATVTNYMERLVPALKANPLVDRITRKTYNDTPITMTRNAAAKDALEAGADFLLMIDNDMDPDVEFRDKDPDARLFWESSIEFLLDHGKPAAIGAPYCGPPPHENVFVFKPARLQSDCPPEQFSLAQFTREEAAGRGGIEEVAALPTGLFLVDTRVFKIVPPTWFDYEYADPPYNTRKDTTEDVYLTRNAALCGVRQFCNWDAWAGHWKKKNVRKPRPFTMDLVRDTLHEAINSGRRRGERLVMIGEGRS